MSIHLITENRKARHDFAIVEVFEAGLVLVGSEVKSLRDKQVQLKDSYVVFIKDEAFLQNVHIAEYSASSYNNHIPERRRKLLMHRRELDKIYAALREKGYACIPLKMYFKEGRAKVEIALAKGKNAVDKRDSVKKRDVDRSIRQTLRRDRS